MTDTINTNQTRVYALSSENGYISNSYTSAPLSAFAWVLDPATGATKSPPTANTAATTWKLASLWHAEVNFRAYCKGYFVDKGALRTALIALDRLDRAEKPAKALFTAVQVDAIVQRLADYESTDKPTAQSLIEPFLTRLAELRNLLDGGFAQSTKQTYTDFYLSAAGLATKNAVFDNYATKFFLIARSLFSDNSVLEGGGPGPTNLFTTSETYSAGVEATAKTKLKIKFALYFETNASTGVATMNQSALAQWLTADMGSITTDSTARQQYDPAADVALMAAALTIQSLGGPEVMEVVPVTATAVAVKKAEVEALGVKVDNHYATFASNTSTVLEQMIAELLDTMDLRAILPEIVSRVVDNRFFLTTWVTAWGEESSPSPPSDVLEMDQNDVGVIARPAPPGNATELGIVGWRAYRSNVGTAGTDFQLVPDLYLVTNSAPQGSYEDVIRATYTEVYPTGWYRPTADDIAIWKKIATTGTAGTPWTNTKLRTEMLLASANSVADTVLPNVKAAAIALTTSTASLLLSDGAFNCFKLATTSYNDAAKSAQLQDTLATTTWLPPPAGLRGLTSMANGVMAGFVDNTVCFSEAYTPYAWPVEYQITVDYPVVAIAAFGQSLFVGTRGSVHIISGSDPSSMSAQILPGGQSCVGAKSVVADEYGVVFASAEGICRANSSAVQVVSKNLFTRTDWELLNPSTMVSFLHDGVYYFKVSRTVPEVLWTRRAIVEDLYTSIGRVGSIAPTETDITFWVNEATAFSWSSSTLRKNFLTEAARFVDDPDYRTQAEAAVALLGVTPTTVITQVYAEVGKVLTDADLLIWVNLQIAWDWTNEVLRLIMLQAADTLKGDPKHWKSADIAVHLLRDLLTEVGYSLNMTSGKLSQVDLDGSAFYVDRVSDAVFSAEKSKINVLHSRVSALFKGSSARRSVYRTGIIKLPKPTHLAWLQVDSDWSSPVVIRWLGDGGVAKHVTVLYDNKPVRLPSGVCLEHEVEVFSLARVTGVTLASTTQELQNV